MFGNIFNQKKTAIDQQPVIQTQTLQTTAPLAQPDQQIQTNQQQAPAQQVLQTTQNPLRPTRQVPVNQAQPAVAAVQSNQSIAVPRPEMSALSHLDPRSSQVLTHAQEETKRIKQQFIEPDQLLFGLLYDEQIYRLLGEFSVDGGQLSKEIQTKEKMGIYKGLPALSKLAQQVFDQAYRDAKMRGSNFIAPEDILIVLFSSNFSTASYLQLHGLKKEAVIEKLSKIPNSEYGRKTILEKYGIDLTEEAREGHLDPVSGRDKEIDRIIHILLRRTKNNPIIIGETGVGKTAIVEGLAQKIVAGGVPRDLQDKRIFQLDVASLVAGASHRGEFEERLRGVINEVLGSNNRIILFIDEIHTLMANSGDEGASGGAANIIKPHLARGHFQLIGATTTTEYRKNFEKDKAFERRFQPVTAEEPNDENAFEMLKVLRPKYEKFHHVTIPDDALKECVKLSKKYIGERFLPDKAIDLLDEACSEVKLQTDAGKRGDSQVKKPDIEKVVSAWTGIPITKLTEDESEKLLRLEDRIHKRLVDQEEAVVAVSEAVRRGRIGLAAANRPIASFVFLGPTGVGKTELAKTLAEILFGRDDAMARLDMSEYMEKHEVAKLIGAPPGYVGYEEGGQLTEAVRKKPYSIVLLDEIEKAHPDVFNILLQLLEDGRLTDNRGNTISFKNTIVICTSNIGSSLIQQQLSLQDPKVKKTPEEYDKGFKQLSNAVRDELIKFFRPELLNRFDEVVIFKPLRPEHMAGIARLGIAKTAALLREQGFNLQITERAIAKLAVEGYDPVYGARPLRRLIQTTIENPIALAIIAKKFLPGDTIVIEYNENINEFVFTKGNQQTAKVSLNDDQFKIILLKIAEPNTITNEQEKQQYVQLHEQTVKASVGGNKTASAILGVNAATSKAEIQLLRKELEDARAKDDGFAKIILELAEKLAVKEQMITDAKMMLLELVNPAKIADVEKRAKYTQIHDQLTAQSQQNNTLAMAILSVTDATPTPVIDKIMEELKNGKDQEDELAEAILSLLNTEIADEAEVVHEAQPLTKFKRILQQIINPLYLATPENKQKFNQIYDKLSQANQQNNPLAASILSLTDITSDDDIAQLKVQLEQARDQGDPLAKDILDTITAAVTNDILKRLKYTLLYIVNPLAAMSAQARETFTDIREKVTEASQKNNALAARILSVTDKITDSELTVIQSQLEDAQHMGDEIAQLVMDACEITQQLLDENSNTIVDSSAQVKSPGRDAGTLSTDKTFSGQTYPFGIGDQSNTVEMNPVPSSQTQVVSQMQPPDSLQSSNYPYQQGNYPQIPGVQTGPDAALSSTATVVQEPYKNPSYTQQSFDAQPISQITSNGIAMKPTG